MITNTKTAVLSPAVVFALLAFNVLAAGAAGEVGERVSTGPEPKPNIIFIMADDMGYGSLGSYGQEMIKTPNLDRMATEGMRFTRHYSGSTVCAPSRGALMTGLHTGHAYIKGNFAMQTEGNLPIPDSTVTVAGLLREAGYTTAMIGKWGLGGPGSVGGPNSQGFDYSFGYLDQRNAHEYYPPYVWKNEQKYPLDNQNTPKEYSHDLFTAEALSFIQAHKDKPFFLYLPYTIPHGAFQVPDDTPYTDESWSQDQKNYAAMITRMDRDIGKILDLLKFEGLDENTVVFFTSDNGGVRGMSDFFRANGSFRGYKRDMYEGGIRVPMIVRWPEKIQSGSVSKHLSASWDFLPTACELAGTSPPDDIDGISFLPELLGDEQKEHAYLYWENFKYYYGWNPGDEGPRNEIQSQAVRIVNWKGIRHDLNKNPHASVELYNLSTDREESNDVAAQNRDIVRQIESIMQTARNDTEFFRANYD